MTRKEKSSALEPGWRVRAACLSVLMLVLSACGGGGTDTTETSAPPEETTTPVETTAPEETAPPTTEGPWTFTDDRGVEIVRDQAPTKIVAYGPAVAAALMHLGVTPVGVFGALDAPNHYGDLDTGDITSLGEAYGEINLETLAALDADLVVTAFDPRQTDGGVDGHALPFGFADGEQFEKVDEIAPVVAIEGIGDNSKIIARFEELAAALGADLEAPMVAGGRDRYEAAVETLQAAAAENPGVLTMAMGAWPGDAVYYAHPSAFPDLRDFEQWGVDMFDPPGQVDAGTSFTQDYFWNIVSFENADQFQSDLLLYVGELGALTPDDLAEHPTLGQLPAVQSGQLVPWTNLVVWSYEQYAKLIEAVAEGVSNADPDLVP